MKVHAMWVLFEAEQEFSSARRTVDECRMERLQTLEMVTVYMAEKACERVVPAMKFPKVVNSNFRKLLYESFKCRHMLTLLRLMSSLSLWPFASMQSIRVEGGFFGYVFFGS